MHLVTGDLWNELGKAQLILVTTNGTLTRAGELVMGAGVARQAKERFPDLPGVLAGQMWQYGFPRYGILPGHKYQETWVGAFQTKIEWHDPSLLDLIQESTDKLSRVAGRFERIALNFPGIGNGQLSYDQVLPIIEQLPDNVYVYKKG